jgi:hypothetical protein
MLDWSPIFAVLKIVKWFIIFNGEKPLKVSTKSCNCARPVWPHMSILVCILNIFQKENGYSGSFYVKDPISKHFILI